MAMAASSTRTRDAFKHKVVVVYAAYMTLGALHKELLSQFLIAYSKRLYDVRRFQLDEPD